VSAIRWWCRWLWRRPVPVLTPATGLDADRQRLQGAIDAAGYACVECGTTDVTLERAPGGWVPVITHHVVGTGSCPCTHGGIAAIRAGIDLLDGMVATVAVPDYGADVWHRRERVTA
jgi:hypothetical protein